MADGSLHEQTSRVFDCAGSTTTGERYSSISAMWQNELSSSQQPTAAERQQPTDISWYKKSAEYWRNQSASVQGMLGGLGELDTRDVNASQKFLDALQRTAPFPPDAIALDVGAGIGRVTKHLLAPRFNTVDMLEQNPQYLKESTKFIGTELESRIQKRIACGMQDFAAAGVLGSDGEQSDSLMGRYHLVWIQWCIIYLTDDDLITFLCECKKALAPGGLICLKDNVARSGFLVDKEDSSIMRSDKYLKHLFRSAEVEVIREAKQVDFPRNIFPVRSYALRPMHDHASAPRDECYTVTANLKS